MSDQPFFSVVCPTFNSAAYISQTIDSVINQTYKNFEIIFIDDGSCDNTLDILNEKKKLIELEGILVKIIESSHLGPGAARNRGIKESSSSWISFLDSDDLWHAEKLQHVYDTLTSDTSCNFIIHWERYKKLNGKTSNIMYCNDYNHNKPIGRYLYKMNRFSTSAVVLKKNILDAVGGFNEHLPCAQDYDLWLKLSDLINLAVIKEYLGYYVELQGSISTRPYYKRLPYLFSINIQHRNKSNFFHFLYKQFKLIFSREWIHLTIKIIFRKKGH